MSSLMKIETSNYINESNEPNESIILPTNNPNSKKNNYIYLNNNNNNNYFQNNNYQKSSYQKQTFISSFLKFSSYTIYKLIFSLTIIIFFFSLKKYTSYICHNLHLQKEKTTLQNRLQFYNSHKIDYSLNTTEKLNYIKSKYLLEKTVIPVSYAFDNNYVLVSLVSLTSMLLSCDTKTFYDIYILTPGDFSEKNKEKLKIFERNFFFKCSINIINFGEKFKNIELAPRDRIVTTPTFYRLDLPNILENITKIIYLDSDTLILKDLNELYQIDIKEKYLLGFLDNSFTELDRYNITNYTYICAGVLLMNLEKLRNEKMVEKFYSFIEKNEGNLPQHDQNVINAVCYQKIGLIPPKYGIPDYVDSKKNAIDYLNDIINDNKYKKEDLIEAVDNPSIIHFISSKPQLNSNPQKKNEILWNQFTISAVYINEYLFDYKYIKHQNNTIGLKD